jgi:hypothetical protein
MTWAFSTRHMKRVSSLEAAERLWGTTPPWRTEHTSWRPLAERRAKHKRLVKLSDERGYRCVLGNSPLVTYLADGAIELYCYDTHSSRQFAHCVSPLGCQPISSFGRFFWQVETNKGVRYYRDESSALLLIPTSYGKWKVMNSSYMPYEWRHDRALAAAVRKKLKPYSTWYELTRRLGVPLYSSAYSHRGAIETLLETPEAYELYPSLAPQLGSPQAFLNLAYEITGARYKVPVPPDRLPRNYA